MAVPLPSLSFLLGVLVLFYFSTFVLFSLLRIVTGISIQRIGYSGLRRIAYTPRDGLKIEIRGIGLHVHRPTFAQPTWISLVVTELQVTADLTALRSGQSSAQQTSSNENETSENVVGVQGSSAESSKTRNNQSTRKGASKTWAKLTDIKEKIKRVHRIIVWISLFDIMAQKSSIVILGVGTIQVGSILLSVDTRPTTVDRRRLFQHGSIKTDQYRPAEWTLGIRSILFTAEGKDSIEILDHSVVNVHGFLHPRVDGLRNASISLKVGRLTIPYDDLVHSSGLARQEVQKQDNLDKWNGQAIEDNEDAQEEKLRETLADAQDFVRSTLQGIHEISLAVSFVGISKRVDSVRPGGRPAYLNMSTKEVGMDLYRLDSSTPAHSMYFTKQDIAHQALLTALSFSVGVDDGQEHPERLLYIPMSTATVKTTLPANILKFSKQQSSSDWNTNVFFANLVITSPSIDLDPKHLPLVSALMESKGNPNSSSSSIQKRSHFVSQLLPKANVKLSIQEPVLRVSLPPVEKTRNPDDFDFDLLISAISSISLEVDSFHSSENQNQYRLSSTIRIASHRLYYQTTSKQHYDLLIAESLELKTHVTASTQLSVSASANFQTFSMFMVREEINEGIRQIVRQLRVDTKHVKLKHSKSSHGPKFLRAVPPWLQHFNLQASDFNIEVAGVDKELSHEPRGLALHLDSWSAEYKAHKDDKTMHTDSRRRGSKSQKPEEITIVVTPPKPKKPVDETDGRRLAIHVRGFEAFIIELAHTWEQEAFLSMPRAEVAFTSGADGQGPTLHINTYVQSLYMRYSLFRHYCVGVATTMLRRTFSVPHAEPQTHSADSKPMSSTDSTNVQQVAAAKDLLVFDARVEFVQIKANLPSDPLLMLHLNEIQASHHRYTTPSIRAFVFRLYADAPNIPHAWNRIISIKSPKIDLRESRRVTGSKSVIDKSIDFSSEAIRIGVPHSLVVHKIFDNFANTVKTVAQLHHRFKTGSDEYILAKHPESAKHVPKISVRTNLFLFEIEDSAFDYKLGIIYRAGMVEQKQRIAREEAFRLKCQKIQLGTNAGTSKFRSASSTRKHHRRSSSHDRQTHERRHGRRHSRARSSSPATKRGRQIRYDREGTCGLSNVAQTSIAEAAEKLKNYNSRSWKKRIDTALAHQTDHIQNIRRLMWGMDHFPDHYLKDEVILQIPRRPALMAILISDVNINIDKPSFPLSECKDFLHRVGKGLPRDTLFGLLIPLHARFEMGEARATLRDYPLPLLHIPALRPGQSAKLPSWSFKSDFVIAEEFRDFESTRDLKIMVIPPDKLDSKKKTGGFAIDVRRTVSPVKMYSDISMEVHTARDTRFTWGTSYQPAIQDMMQVIEGFTKPQIDPSDRVGFWDKIRLSFHSRINVAWKGDGDVHLTLKGSRDPYTVTGYGTGFVMVWRNDVQWNIWHEEDPTKFMTVDSGDYVLAIPDFSPQAREIHSQEMQAGMNRDNSSTSSYNDGPTFKKVIMKLSGKVKWVVGLVFERNLDDGGRSFDFEPHYNVTLKNPAHVKHIRRQDSYDAFRGFRSHHIHMSIGISAPSDRDWSAANIQPSTNYNAVHLSPRFFTHFFSWWGMFSGAMSLPIRQGKLFPGIEKSGKKFGRHLGTIKYSLLFSPLFLSHVYKHKEAEEFTEDTVSATGLKMKLDSFMLDLHQRREEFDSDVKGMSKKFKTTGMRMNQGLVDLVSADIRAVSAGITGTSAEAVRRASDERLAGYQHNSRAIDLSKFTIPDNDFGWIDADDFVEVDWTLPTDSDPETKILPLAFFPRFTYRRQTDHHHTISGDRHRHSPFGYESTHDCIMSTQNDPRRVQIDLVQERIKRVEQQLEEQHRLVSDQELLVVRATGDTTELKKKLEELRCHCEIMESKVKFLRKMSQDLNNRLALDHRNAGPNRDQLSPENNLSSNADDSETESAMGDTDIGNLDYATLADHVSDFNNRFVIHNAHIKWNNSLRNIMLRYIHQVSQRRGFVYYTSRRAVKFILDIIEEQKRNKEATNNAFDHGIPQAPGSPMADDELSIQDRIAQLMADGKDFVDADDPEAANGNQRSKTGDTAKEDVAHEFMAQNTYHLRLVAPQIQLQSEKNVKAAVLVTARGMRLKVFQIMDKDRVSDDVSGLVQRRFSAEMDNMQFFVTSKDSFASEYVQSYSGNHYGAIAGSAWPPWVPVEGMFDFYTQTYGFHRVVQRTSATLRYDKYNKLRLKYNESVSHGQGGNTHNPDNFEHRMDHIWINFPHVRAICDSDQYYMMYIIVLDLLLWSEPLEKTRNERLEKIMLASDFSDLRGAPEMVIMLQERIRQLEQIKVHFHMNEKYLDRQGWQDRIMMEQDLASCEDELFFIMKAITTSQRKTDDRTENAQVNGLIRYYLSASEIVWHLTKEADQALVEFQLGNASFERTDNSDGSNKNSVNIDRINGLNLLPNAVYPEIIAPYSDQAKPHLDHSNVKMVRVDWLMLEPIAGIPVVDYFEVSLFPLKIQLEYETGRQIFEYVFPGMGNGEEGFSPFMVKHQLPQTDEDVQNQDKIDVDARRAKATEESMKQTAGSATGAGSLEHRLKPTIKLPDNSDRHKTGNRHGLGINSGAESGIQKFLHDHHPRRSSNANSSKLKTKASNDSINTTRGKDNARPSSTVTSGSQDNTKHKRFALGRTPGSQNSDTKSKSKKSDDLTQMLNRASNYMTLSYVKIPSVVLCLSYKGKGNRNFEDVHMLVFRMPTLEYRNKTWSNLDLALALKKDIIRALISHTGAIIGNKFSHHKPGKNAQSKLRELASSSVVLSSSADVSRIQSETSSLRGFYSIDEETHPKITDGSENEDAEKAESYASSVSVVGVHHTMETTEPSDKAVGDHSRSESQDPSVRSGLSRRLSEFTHKSRRRDTLNMGSEELSDGSAPQRKRGLGIGKILHSVSHR